MGLVLGIDTSCYTTSLAVVNQKAELLADIRDVLPVGQGGIGLRQSEAVFKHLQNLPVLVDRVCELINPKEIKVVAVSSKPRPSKSSYLPVFTVGTGFGRITANFVKATLVETTHQEGHITAGLWSAGLFHWTSFPGRGFLVIQVSGGTSEILWTETVADGGFKIKRLGGTLDIHAGQLIDRVGVRMGLPFPSGPALEDLARRASPSSKWRLKSFVKGKDFSFSGAETQALRWVEKGVPFPQIARAIEQCIAKTLEKVVHAVFQDFAIREVLIVGGVAANQYLRKRLSYRLEHPAVGAKLYFALPNFSSDNAVGTALNGLNSISVADEGDCFNYVPDFKSGRTGNED